VQITLHPEITVEITVNVARSDDEAERQARGEDVTVIQDEALELETFDPDAEFGDGEDDDSAEQNDSTEHDGATDSEQEATI